MTKRAKAKADAMKYERDIERMIADYIAETGDTDWTRLKVAAWIIKNNKWQQREVSAIKELARTISRVARKVSFKDENGERVRKYHAWRLGYDQPMFWSGMESISREHMNHSVNARRDKSVNGLVKAQIDADYYNRHYNPGDPIQIETDLTQDVVEKRQGTLYDDVPPHEENTGK